MPSARKQSIHSSHRFEATTTTRRNAVLAPVARSSRNMPLPLRIQSKPNQLLLLAPTRNQHSSPDRRTPERVLVLTNGALPQFGIRDLHLKRGFDFVIGEAKHHDSANRASLDAGLGCVSLQLWPRDPLLEDINLRLSIARVPVSLRKC